MNANLAATLRLSAIRIFAAQRGITFRYKLAFSTSSVLEKDEEPEIPSNPLAKYYSASSQPENGFIYDKKPFRLRLIEGKTYYWCLCGRSKNQPLCDGTHKNDFLKIKLRPIKFTVTKDKDYWLCNCKQTSNRPFCDGTHKREDIQALIR